MSKKNKSQPEYKYDKSLFLLIMAFISLGLFTLLSTTLYTSGTFYFYKQINNIFVGLVAMFIAMRIDFYSLRKRLKPAMNILTFLLFATYVPFLGGTTVNGASGWLRIPIINFGFQPAEIAKIILVIFTANLLSNPEYEKLKLIEKIITLFPTAGILGLIVFQPDIGNASVIVLSVFSIYFIAGLSILKIFSVISILITAFSYLVLYNPYQFTRLTICFDPWQDEKGYGYQLVQSLLAIGSGGLTGKGLGNSIQKLYYLPEKHTDFIFSVYSEETGLIGGLFMLLLILLLARSGFKIAINVYEPFIKLLSVGITVMICGQALINMGVVTCLFPTTGITLPFISYGGTSMIISLFSMGLLLNASRYTMKK